MLQEDSAQLLGTYIALYDHVFERRDSAPFPGLRLWHHLGPRVRTAHGCEIG